MRKKEQQQQKKHKTEKKNNKIGDHLASEYRQRRESRTETWSTVTFRRKDNSVKTLRRKDQEDRKETAKCIVL